MMMPSKGTVIWSLVIAGVCLMAVFILGLCKMARHGDKQIGIE